LEKARIKAEASGLDIEWVHQDMRDFVRPESFDLVLSLFTSFGYFDDKKEDRKVLENIFSNLREAGNCLIDLVGKENLARIFQPTDSHNLSDGSILVERHEIFDGWTRIRLRIVPPRLQRGSLRRYPKNGLATPTFSP
jgi:SAM-dependent methyltransferase